MVTHAEEGAFERGATSTGVPPQSAGATWLNLRVVEACWLRALWGSPTEGEITSLVDCASRRDPTEPTRAWLVDFSALEDVTLTALGRLMGAIDSGQRCAEGTRCAIVVARGRLGVMLQEVVQALAQSPIQAVFDSLEPGLDWLAPGAFEAEKAAALQVHRRCVVSSGLLQRLRPIINQNLTDPSLVGSARQLGLSARTLQRQLADLGTSFRRETAEARLERAKLRLAGDRASVTQIAFELGFASVESFIRGFKSGVGVTPGVWMRRHASLAAGSGGGRHGGEAGADDSSNTRSTSSSAATGTFRVVIPRFDRTPNE